MKISDITICSDRVIEIGRIEDTCYGFRGRVEIAKFFATPENIKSFIEKYGDLEIVKIINSPFNHWIKRVTVK